MTSFLSYYNDFSKEKYIEDERDATPSDEDFSRFKSYKQFKLNSVTEINKKNSKLSAAKTQRLKNLEGQLINL